MKYELRIMEQTYNSTKIPLFVILYIIIQKF